MAKGPIITDQIQVLIASVYQKHPKWKAPEVRNEVDHILHTSNPKLPLRWPSLSTVQKVLAIVRKRMKEGIIDPDPRDKPWSTATMAEYPIPAEALPSILKLWVWTHENMDINLTIRQAQWAARFYTVTKDMGILSAFVRGHALSEVLSTLLGKPFENSDNTDLIMFGLITGQEITPERQKQILGLSDEEWLYHQELERLLDKEDYSSFGKPPKEVVSLINYMRKAEEKGDKKK